MLVNYGISNYGFINNLKYDFLGIVDGELRVILYKYYITDGDIKINVEIIDEVDYVIASSVFIIPSIEFRSKISVTVTVNSDPQEIVKQISLLL